MLERGRERDRVKQKGLTPRGLEEFCVRVCVTGKAREGNHRDDDDDDE